MIKKNIAIKLSLFINYSIFAILLNSVGTVILQVQSSLGVSATTASVLEAFKDLSIAITSFCVASFITRIGYKSTMLIALTLIFTASITLPLLPTFFMTKVMFAIVGISFALTKVSTFATLGLITKGQREHVRWMSFLESFFMVGILSGYFIFSFFIDDSNPQSMAWVTVYYILAAMAFFAFVLLLLSPLDESKATVDSSTSATDEFLNMLKLCVNPLVLIFALSIFLYVLIEQGIMLWLPTFNHKILDLPASLSVQMASILAASIALGRFIAGIVAKKIDWYPLLNISIVLAASLILIALPLAENFNSSTVITSWFDAPIAAFIFPMIGVCLAPIYPIINSVILSSIPTNKQASMTGLIVVFSALGGTTGSMVTGALFDRTGGTLAFYFSLIPMTLTLVILYLLKRRIEKPQLSEYSTNRVAW